MDKNSYNFNTKPKHLSDSTIKGYMDFDALLEKHTQQAPAKGGGGVVRVLKWLAPIAAAAAVIAFFLIPTITQKNQYPTVAKTYFEETPFINPPIPKAVASFASQKVDAYKGGVYEYKNGSKIIVPTSAFVDEAGKVIGGEVEIRYKEYQDFVDFFLSGIPMHYDSLDQRYQLESAGMVEFYAQQNGKRINVAPNKSIQVELKGSVMVDADNANQIPDFNIYKLEVGKRNWAYHGANNMAFTTKMDNPATALARQKQNVLDEQKRALANMENNLPKLIAPIAPRTESSSLPSFELDFADMEVEYDGDLRQYEGQIWRMAERNDEFVNGLSSGRQWEDVKLVKINDQLFEITLIVPTESLKGKVYPALKGAELQAAQERYAMELEKYNAAMANRAEQLATEKEKIIRKYTASLAALEETRNKPRAERQKIRREVISRFVATDFGIWNVDRPINPHAVKVHGSFVSEQQGEIANRVAYLADSDRNTVSRLLTTQRSPVGFNPSAKTFMWVVTEDKKIAVYRPENFAQIKNEDDSYTFVLKESEKVIETETELRSILSL